MDVGLAKRKCLHFVTLSPDVPTFSPWQLSAPAAARSEGGREGTMSRGPGMCPQLLFTNTELFMTAGERNSTPAPSSQTSRAAGAWESRAPRLFLGRAVGKVSRAPGARRGCRARLRCGRGSLCLGDAEGAPSLGLARAWGRCAPPVPSAATLGAGLPDLHPSVCLSPNPAPGKLPIPEKKKSTSEAEISDKS